METSAELEQLAEETADLRGQLGALDEHQEIGSITIDGQAGVAGVGGITQDGWRTFTYKSGWSDRGAGFANGRYRRSPDGYYTELSGQCSATLGTGGSGNTIATLPSGYYDTGNDRTAPCALASNLPGTGSPRVTIQSNGDLVLNGFGSAAAVIVQLDGTRVCIYSATGV